MWKVSKVPVVVAIVLFVLTGCTFSPSPVEPPRVGPTDDPTVRPAEFDLSTVDPSGTGLECEPAADWAIDWVTTHFTQSIDSDTPALPEEYFAMVRIGEGDRADQTWWIVAVVSHDDMAGRDSGKLRRHDMSFLTDSEQWINVGSFHATRPNSADWSMMLDWSDEQILRGMQAQKKALSCLPPSL